MQRVMPFIAVAILTCSAPLAAPAGGTNIEFKAYSIGFADGKAAVQVVKDVVGGDGKVILDAGSKRLLVLTTPEKHAEVDLVVRELNVPPKNVRIEVQFLGSGTESNAGIAAQGNGQVVFGHGSRATVRLGSRVENGLEQSTSNTKQQLLVSSGSQASIFVGENVPYLEWLVDYGLRYGYIERRMTWQQVGAKLVVEPTVLGDGPVIRVRLIPELSGLIDGNPYRTRFANVATEVTVTDGVPFSLGGISEHQDFYSRFLVGYGRAGTARELNIVLTARIVSETGR